ncbi:CoA binding domain-containing protein [Echria macrotheca]|uniref:CoA binding domain-containing protein n=1 Tax=Echria macrotheca TaxID=438768 RepID=A0AAJ0B3D1_9PEZI|nr:CoA binding domain-containing protein [Echria macrotheca]
MAATDATLRAFFQSPNFAVVGASNDTHKYGYKVFKWYLDHSLPVTPINPSSKTIKAGKTEHDAVTSLSELPSPAETGVSIITPPSVTRKVLAEAAQLGVPAVFLQPGTYDDEVLAFARENFKAAVGGTDGGWGGEGWCVLVDGERGMRAAGKL